MARLRRGVPTAQRVLRKPATARHRATAGRVSGGGADEAAQATRIALTAHLSVVLVVLFPCVKSAEADRTRAVAMSGSSSSAVPVAEPENPDCTHCGRTFDTVHGRNQHWRCSVCGDLEARKLVVSQTSVVQQVVTPNEQALIHRANERLEAALRLTTRLRIEKLMPSAHVQHFKDALSTELLPLMRRHLTIELAPHVTCRSDELEVMLMRCTDMFRGMQSSVMEHGKLIMAGGERQTRTCLAGPMRGVCIKSVSG